MVSKRFKKLPKDTKKLPAQTVDKLLNKKKLFNKI